MRSSFLTLPSLALTGLLTFVGCSTTDDANRISGTATDTENTIASVKGVVTRTDGKVSANASIRMARISSESASLAVPAFVEIQTDSVGEFSIDSVLADSFQLAVIDTVAGEVYYLPKVAAGSSKLEAIKLAKAATINSKLLYQETAEPEVAVGSHFTAFLPGTPFSRSVFAGDSFSLLVPAGKVSLAFCPGDPQIISKLSEYGVADSLIYRSWQMEKGSVKEGDTLNVGPFIWSISPNVAVDSIIKEREATGRISGVVKCKSTGKPCAGVEVQMVTDLYGFNFKDSDSLVFKPETVTDSLGRWFLRVPAEVPFDSFRVEYRRLSNDSVIEVGLSKYVKAKELKDLKDTFDVGETQLHNPSKIRSSVRVVVQDTIELDKSVVNSVVMGIMGTTHFVRELTWNDISMTDLPDDEQELVLYTGDQKVLTTLKDSETSLDKFITRVNINLPEGKTLEQQGMTYNPSVYK